MADTTNTTPELLALGKQLTHEQRLRHLEICGRQWHLPLSLWREVTFPAKQSAPKVKKSPEPVKSTTAKKK